MKVYLCATASPKVKTAVFEKVTKTGDVSGDFWVFGSRGSRFEISGNFVSRDTHSCTFSEVYIIYRL
jgi:hypothetical protein